MTVDELRWTLAELRACHPRTLGELAALLSEGVPGHAPTADPCVCDACEARKLTGRMLRLLGGDESSSG